MLDVQKDTFMLQLFALVQKKKKKDMHFSWKQSQFVALFLLKKKLFPLWIAKHKYVETGTCVSGWRT